MVSTDFSEWVLALCEASSQGCLWVSGMEILWSSSQQAGAGDVLEKLLRAGAKKMTYAMGFLCSGAMKSVNTEILHE